MLMYFTENGKKPLKRLNMDGLPPIGTKVTIRGKKYKVIDLLLDASTGTYSVILQRFFKYIVTHVRVESRACSFARGGFRHETNDLDKIRRVARAYFTKKRQGEAPENVFLTYEENR